MQEGIELAGSDFLVERARFQNDRGEVELVGQFLSPLFAQVCRQNHQQAALALGPLLREQEARLDGLPKPDFIRQNRPFGERAAEGKEGSLDLVRIEIDLSIGEHGGKLLNTIRGRALG